MAWPPTSATLASDKQKQDMLCLCMLHTQSVWVGKILGIVRFGLICYSFVCCGLVLLDMVKFGVVEFGFVQLIFVSSGR